MNNPKTILVYGDWQGLHGPALMGHLYVETSRGKETVSFQYDTEWLSSRYAQSIDPALHLFKGRQYPEIDRTHFGIFLDSSPDRWGKLLMRRREAIPH